MRESGAVCEAGAVAELVCDDEHPSRCEGGMCGYAASMVFPLAAEVTR